MFLVLKLIETWKKDYYGIGTKKDRVLADIWLNMAEFYGIKD